MKKQVEMSIQDGNGNEFVAYPKTHKEHVQFENGMNIDEFVGQDIATPTITHDTTAIKVGVGDSDVSSSVVDSTVNMTIKGQTYQNILPDPTLRNEMQGKSMQRLNEGYDSIETVDGVSKSAILKGQTLVNIENTLFPKTTGWYDNNGVNSFYRNAEIISMMNPNTDYLLYVEALPTVSQFLSVSGGLFGAKAVNLTNGKAIAKVTTTDVLPSQATNYFKSSVGGNLTQEEKESIKLMIIKYQEGMENWDIPYFEGLCDVKAPTLKNVGKNLFDMTMVETDTLTVRFWDTTITRNTIKSVRKGDNVAGQFGAFLPLKVKPSTTYTIQRESYKNNQRVANGIAMYVYHNSSIWGYSLTSSMQDSFSFTTLPDTDHITIGVNYGVYDIGTILETRNIQLEESDVQTLYEDHKTNILETSNDVVLRGLPNGVKDSYDCLTGEYVQRVGEIVFDGSNDENWFENYNFPHNGQIVYGIRVTNLNGGVPYPDGISDTLPFIRKGYESNKPSVSTYMKDIYVRINGSTKEDLKAYLSQNPITVQYELAEPIVTTIEPSTTPFAYENGHIILESGHEGQSLLPTLEYQTVVSRSGQVAMIDKTIQQHERKITLLEKMLVQNIIDIEYKNTLLALKLEIDEVI